MGLFDSTSRSLTRDHSDIYREKADRLAEETRLLFAGGRLSDAEERVRELIEYQAKVVGERHPEYATGLCMLAEVLSALEELGDAETLIQRALEIRKKALGEGHVDYASGLDQMGRLMLRWEDFVGAEPLLVKALEIRRAALGEDDPEYGESLTALAEVHLGRDDPVAAERLLRESLAVLRRALGESHPELAACLARLSQVLLALGQTAEAETLLRQSVEMYKQECGETHPDHMKAMTALASLLQRRGDLNAAEPIWRLLLDMKRQARGVHLSDLANIQTQLAVILQRRGDLKGAEALHRQALELTKNVQGERHPEFAAGLTNLALLLQRTEDLQGAETLLRQALAIRKEVLGQRHPEYATSLVNLALLVQKRGDTAWARMLLKEAVEVRRAIFGEEHADYAQSLAALADVLAQQGELARSEELLRKSLAIRSRALGDIHPVYATNLSSLAGVLRRIGNLAEAETLLRQALQIRKVAIGEDHPDYATNLGNLAWLLQRKGDREGAEALLTQALQIRKRLLGEQHPDYQQNLERLKSLGQSSPAADQKTARGHKPALAVSGERAQTGNARTEDRFAATTLPPVSDPEDAEVSLEPSEGASFDKTSFAGCSTATPVPDLHLPPFPDAPCPSGVIGPGHSAPPAQSGSEDFVASRLAGSPRDGDDIREEDVSPGESVVWQHEGNDETPKPVGADPHATAADDPLIRLCESQDPGIDADNKVSETTTDAFLSGTLDLPTSRILPEDASDDPPELTPGLSDDTHEKPEQKDVVAQTGETADVDSRSLTLASVCGKTVGIDPVGMPGVTFAGDQEPARSPSMSESNSRSESGVAYAEETEPTADHPTDASSSHLSQELAALSDLFSDLGERLLSASRQLLSPGSPPPEDLLEALSACRNDFRSLRGRTIDLAGSLFVTSPPPDALTSLEDLTGLLDHIAEAEIHQSKSEEQRRRSLSVLDRVLAITHASNGDFTPLRECQDKARELRYEIAEGKWATLPSEAERLAEGQHHFADLLTLIGDHDELHDEHWATLHESVGQNFGKALAAAAARSKLVMAQHSVAPESQA